MYGNSFMIFNSLYRIDMHLSQCGNIIIWNSNRVLSAGLETLFDNILFKKKHKHNITGYIAFVEELVYNLIESWLNSSNLNDDSSNKIL